MRTCPGLWGSCSLRTHLFSHSRGQGVTRVPQRSSFFSYLEARLSFMLHVPTSAAQGKGNGGGLPPRGNPYIYTMACGMEGLSSIRYSGGHDLAAPHSESPHCTEELLYKIQELIHREKELQLRDWGSFIIINYY